MLPSDFAMRSPIHAHIPERDVIVDVTATGRVCAGASWLRVAQAQIAGLACRALDVSGAYGEALRDAIVPHQRQAWVGTERASSA
jgi:hypothetical protein